MPGLSALGRLNRRWGLLGGKAFTPAQTVPGVWLDASNLVGLSDGDAVATWTDASGNSRNGTASGTSKPLYKTGVLGSKPALRFDGSDDIMSITIPASGQFTLLVVARLLVNLAANERIAAVGAFGSIQANNIYAAYNDQTKLAFYGNESYALVDTTTDAKPWQSIMYTYTTSALDFYSDNNLMVAEFNPADFPASATAITLGGLVGSNFGNCDIALVGWWPRVLTVAERNNLYNWLKNYLNQTYTVFDGDSQLDEDVSGTISKIMTSKGSAYTATSYAVGGQTMATINTNKANITGRYSSYRKRNVVVIWAGTNDIVGNATTATITGNISAYCTAVKNAGYYVVIINVLARGGLNAGQTTVRSEVNAWIASNYATVGNAMVDVTADARLQNPADTTYFNADQTHLIDAGQAIVAALIAAAI